MTSHYLNQGWKVYWCIYASLGFNVLTIIRSLCSMLESLSVYQPQWGGFTTLVYDIFIGVIPGSLHHLGLWRYSHLQPNSLINSMLPSLRSSSWWCYNMKCFLNYWPFVWGILRWLVDSPWGIHRSPEDSHHKGSVTWELWCLLWCQPEQAVE